MKLITTESGQRRLVLDGQELVQDPDRQIICSEHGPLHGNKTPCSGCMRSEKIGYLYYEHAEQATPLENK